MSSASTILTLGPEAQLVELPRVELDPPFLYKIHITGSANAVFQGAVLPQNAMDTIPEDAFYDAQNGKFEATVEFAQREPNYMVVLRAQAPTVVTFEWYLEPVTDVARTPSKKSAAFDWIVRILGALVLTFGVYTGFQFFSAKSGEGYSGKLAASPKTRKTPSILEALQREIQ